LREEVPLAKQVYVLLAFHAHEPLWEMPDYLMRNSLDRSISQAVRPDNFLSKRTTQGRNVYQEMLAAARHLGVPFTLDISNTLLVQLGNLMPQTLEAMTEAYREGFLRPLYIPAHHTHAALLCQEELREEIALNQEYLHGVLRVPRPRHPGLFFTECSVDSRFVPMVEEMGIEWCVFPELNPRRAAFSVPDPDYDYTFFPFRVGERLIGLPRHFPVSQAIWRPITRLFPGSVKYQGYLMGQYYVFDEEYREKRLLEVPISREQAFEEYRRLLEDTLANTPPGGLILYIQDLELMDFGETALEILTAGWEAVRRDPRWQIDFVGADEYIDEYIGTLGQAAKLPQIGFSQASWAPELRLVLRSDGHYPPLEAGEFRGLDFVAEVHRQRPFLFWEPGHYLTGLFEWLLRSFGFPVLVGVKARLLADEDYQLLRLPYSKRLPLHLRLLKQADNWGWMPNEDQAKRPYLHGFMIADALSLLLKLFPDQYPVRPQPADSRLFVGTGRLCEGIIDTRIAYLTFGLKREQEERGFEPAAAFRELDYAHHFRDYAAEAARSALRLSNELQADLRDQRPWAELLSSLREHCRAMFLSLDHIQRAWAKGGDTEFLVEKMYLYLHDIYPPLFPRIMEEVEGERAVLPSSDEHGREQAAAPPDGGLSAG
jgi:hypothetical protein